MATHQLEPDDLAFFKDSKKTKRLPPWLDHFNSRDLKTLFKCSLAVWILTIFIFIDDTLSLMGQAGFFGCIVLFILPPSGVVFIQLMGGLTIIIGLCLGWVWGVIVMKTALATRPNEDLAAQYQKLQESAPQNTTNVDQASGQATYAQIAIYDGFMLDTRVTVTYYCMLGLFVYLVARIRVAAPQLTLVTIFALVVADVFLTTAPLIPTFVGTIPKMMIIPAAIGVGVGVVCNIFIFPQSASQLILTDMAKVLAPMKEFVKSLSSHLHDPERKFDLLQLEELKNTLITLYTNIEGSNKFILMDISFGKWSPADVKSMQKPLQELFIGFGELLRYIISREEQSISADALSQAAQKLKETEAESGQYPVAYHQISATVELHERARHPEAAKLLSKTLADLSTSVVPFLQVWIHACEAAHDAISFQSNKDSATNTQNHEEALEALKNAEVEFQASVAEKIIPNYSHLLDSDGNIDPTEELSKPALYGLMVGMLLQEHILNLSRTTTGFLERIIEIERERHGRRLWLPGGLQRISEWAFSRDQQGGEFQGAIELTRTMSSARPLPQKAKRKSGFKKISEDEQNERPDTTNSSAAMLENMRKPSSRTRHGVSRFLLALIDWTTNPEGLYALRTLVVTIALAVPAVIPASAGFYYREKGMWAMIMGQLCLEPYTSDFVSGLIVRTLSTIAGGIIGMVCWYIGAGSGPGNPYGLAAVMAVAITLMMWSRLFSPPEFLPASIMLTATLFMVVAYSYVDTHIPSYGNPGVGYAVFWRRLLLVITGFVAAAIVQFVPKPPSGNDHYRTLLAEQLSTVKDRYALYASTWRSPPNDLVETIEKEALISQELLHSLIQPIKRTKYEFSTSNIDTATLEQVRALSNVLNRRITQLLLCTQKLPLELRIRFMRRTSAVDENFIGDLMNVLALVQQSIATGAPMPAVLPTPLINRARRYLATERGFGISGLSMAEQLSQDEGRQWVLCLDAFFWFLGSIDKLVLVMKTAVGETSVVDLRALNLDSA
ncbi:hypothetical protein G7Z17_g11813 [Cylindrodendrum hubeiense]|uniref:ER transporter 6TM N-terminal domain-containing protein n=1 Tax=Cylindrodendrum hubeiense TaxID=595255 RepID=A0A9P5H240_9HYPO|nr:hypothetical protein G7Z17_g11813 [Cylindrodendrum hubeiense]